MIWCPGGVCRVVELVCGATCISEMLHWISLPGMLSSLSCPGRRGGLAPSTPLRVMWGLFYGGWCGVSMFVLVWGRSIVLGAVDAFWAILVCCKVGLCAGPGS